MSAYAQLARLPPPGPRAVDVGALVRRVAELETRLPVGVSRARPSSLDADADQLEQLLINLVRNAATPRSRPQGGVAVGWRVDRTAVEIEVLDEGPACPTRRTSSSRSSRRSRAAAASASCCRARSPRRTAAR